MVETRVRIKSAIRQRVAEDMERNTLWRLVLLQKDPQRLWRSRS